jgi:hypothetical protein
VIPLQTAAIIRDGYRELNARKLFWIAILLSGVVVLAFALVGSNNGNIAIAGWRTPLPLAAIGLTTEALYKLLFLQFGVGFWLAWVSTILALVTTAGMIPDFVTGGAIDLTLSKPIGRVRLFLTKYTAGLLFVALQVTTFTVASFVVLGFRAGAWEPGLFLAIPIMILFFSYLFCVSALVGLLTRSTIAALIVTMLFWFMLFILNTTDGAFALLKANAEADMQRTELRLEDLQSGRSTRERDAATGIMNKVKAAMGESVDNDRLSKAITARDQAREDFQSLEVWHARILLAKALLPKTNETIALLRRSLISSAELDEIYRANSAFNVESIPEEHRQQLEEQDAWTDPESQSQAARKAEAEFRARSVLWIVGTSLGFEAVVLAFCCWIFARRDY